MKKLVSLIFLFSFFSISIFAQQKFEYLNSFQGELGGHGLFYSVNYERVLLNQSKFKMTARLGAAYYPPSSNLIGLWVPLSVNGLVSFGEHHAEIGTGQVFRKDEIGEKEPGNVIGEPDFIQTFSLGYRHQKPDGRYFFRVAFTPFVEVFLNHQDDEWLKTAVHPSGAFAVGYAF